MIVAVVADAKNPTIVIIVREKTSFYYEVSKSIVLNYVLYNKHSLHTPSLHNFMYIW